MLHWENVQPWLIVSLEPLLSWPRPVCWHRRWRMRSPTEALKSPYGTKSSSSTHSQTCDSITWWSNENVVSSRISRVLLYVIFLWRDSNPRRLDDNFEICDFPYFDWISNLFVTSILCTFACNTYLNSFKQEVRAKIVPNLKCNSLFY